MEGGGQKGLLDMILVSLMMVSFIMNGWCLLQ